MRLADELRMSKPFASLEEEAMLSMFKTAQAAEGLTAELLKESEVSPAQYNVLRILRGSDAGLPCGEIADRMITKDPDVTRLLDRLHGQGLVSRERWERDRRVVRAKITAQGLKLLDEMERPLRTARQRLFSGFTEEELVILIRQLERVRQNVANESRGKKERTA